MTNQTNINFDVYVGMYELSEQGKLMTYENELRLLQLRKRCFNRIRTHAFCDIAAELLPIELDGSLAKTAWLPSKKLLILAQRSQAKIHSNNRYTYMSLSSQQNFDLNDYSKQLQTWNL